MPAIGARLTPAVYLDGGVYVQGTNVLYSRDDGSPATARIPWIVKDPAEAMRHIESMRRRT